MNVSGSHTLRPRRSCLGALGLLAWLLTAACEGRPRGMETSRPLSALGGQEKLVVFDLTRDTPETTAGGGFFPVPLERTFAGLVNALQDAREQPAPGYFVRLGTHSFSWAQTAELARLLGALRGPEHPVICHSDGLDNASMWLAARGCDQIWVSPAGSVDTVGLAGQSIYIQRLLERLKVQADFLHVGRYKSAAEMLTQDGPSDAAKESMEAVLSSIRESWLEGVAAHRSDPVAVEALENGPWVVDAALATGLIDAIGYESDARDQLKATTGADEFESAFGAMGRRKDALGLAEVLRALMGGRDSTSQPHVAVLPAQGGISMGANDGVSSDDGITAKEFTKLIRRLKKDDAVKAVVLRIDSPGGSALASDLLWHELMALREKKPLLASVGNMAASGGYYLACAADSIFADPTSIVGSIGVVGGKIVIDDALDEIGVSAYTFTPRGAPGDGGRAAYMSILNDWDESTRERVQEQMNAIYELFIQRVSEGRDMEPEAVLASAEGRIWTGAQGLDRGLVDEFGGLADAIDEARRRANLPSDAPVTLESPRAGLLELLGLGEKPDEDDVQAAFEAWQAARPAWSVPLSPSQRAHVQALWPLLGGERVLAVVPYVFDAR